VAAEHSVELRKTTGPLLLFGGLVGIVVAVVAMRVEWTRATRRSARSLR
jgi:hypothetical protein